MLPVAYDLSLHRLKHSMLLKLMLYQTIRKLRGIDRHIDLLHNVRDSPDVILVSMGYKKALDLIEIILKIRQIRNNEIYSEHIVLRK